MSFVAIALLSVFFICSQSQSTETPNAIVSQDGFGDFRTIAEAIQAAPDHSIERYYIKIKQGRYREYIQIAKNKTNKVLIGEGMDTTIIVGNRSFADGNKTFDTATVGIKGNGFTVQDISPLGMMLNQESFREAAMALFYRCRFEGYQDTLYTKRYRQFYRDFEIYGTIDFICGNATALFQNCLIEARIPLDKQYNTSTAQKRNLKDDQTGLVLQNCSIKAIRDFEKMDNITTYLGRPWGVFSWTVVMESYINHLIDPRGWTEWIDTNKPVVRRPFYLEYKYRGPGAVTKGRVTWENVTTDQTIASNFTVRHFINGDEWISVDIPHFLDLS
ncbi:hypothetical protein BC332_25928 [Capsicum chinense]|nr:hypothetical protein BC332_25928 [Capsicum chinense]